MATEKRLIDVCAEIRKIEDVLVERKEQAGSFTYRVFEAVKTALEKAPTVDAVPIDEIKFLYMAIDKNGIPELKVQLGDRILCLRRENDPVDVVPVVRCKNCKKWIRHTEVDRERGECRRYQTTKHETGFCDRGERKDND